MTRFERWAVWLASAVVGLTGVVYAWMRYLLPPLEPWAAIHHPLEPLVLKLHVVSAPLLVFALGLIAVRHVWQHIRLRVRPGRSSGLAGALVAIPMILSGYLIQVFTDRTILAVLAWVHVVAGVVYLVALGLHHLAVRRLPANGGKAGAGRNGREPASGITAVAAPRGPERTSVRDPGPGVSVPRSGSSGRRTPR